MRFRTIATISAALVLMAILISALRSPEDLKKAGLLTVVLAAVFAGCHFFLVIKRYIGYGRNVVGIIDELQARRGVAQLSKEQVQERFSRDGIADAERIVYEVELKKRARSDQGLRPRLTDKMGARMGMRLLSSGIVLSLVIVYSILNWWKEVRLRYWVGDILVPALGLALALFMIALGALTLSRKSPTRTCMAPPRRRSPLAMHERRAGGPQGRKDQAKPEVKSSEPAPLPEDMLTERDLYLEP